MAKPRKCENCKHNSKCKQQKYFIDNKTGILTCPNFVRRLNKLSL